MNQYVFPVVNYPKIRLCSGFGSYVKDTNGKQYLDLNSGQFCASAGHSSFILRDAVDDFLNSLQDTHTGMMSVQTEECLKLLGTVSGLPNPYSILLSTGSESTEFALRYAKHIKAKDGIIAFDIGYHGITHGAAAYSMSRRRIRPTLAKSYDIPAPLCKDFENSHNFDFTESYNFLKTTLESFGHEIAAFIIEPIISGGGMYKVPINFMKNAIKLCHQHDVFVIFDECQTGAGRLGNWYSYSEKGFCPDFVISGKSIGLGLPVSTVTANGNTVDISSITLEHFSSHQNEAFSAIIVTHFINWIINNKKFEHIKSAGKSLLDGLKNTIGNKKTRPRGEGLMLGFDLTQSIPSNESKTNGNLFVSIGLDQGLLLQHCNYGRTIRILPNYNVSIKETEEFIEKIQKVFTIYEKHTSS